jgi:hypothetical protein
MAVYLWLFGYGRVLIGVHRQGFIDSSLWMTVYPVIGYRRCVCDNGRPAAAMVSPL